MLGSESNSDFARDSPSRRRRYAVDVGRKGRVGRQHRATHERGTMYTIGQFRKSSYSGNQSAAGCVEAAPVWIKSSYSNGGNGSCVEVATPCSHVYVRDSKDPHGGQLQFSRPSWSAFVAGVTA